MFARIARASTVRPLVRFNSTVHKINSQSFVHKYAEQGPTALKFTAEHEWVAVHADNSAFVGITHYAAEALGDATFVELPEVGDRFEQGEALGSVESVKSASEIYSPVKGEVVAVNSVLEGSPQVLNADPMGEGWLVQLKLAEPEAVAADEHLLDLQSYEDSLEH